MSADQPNSGAPTPKTFTTEEVEKLVSGAVAKSQADLLAKLGAKSPEEISAALGKLRETEDAQKSELQKLMERATKAETEAASAKAYRERLATYTGQQLAALPEAQRAVVERLAGDDPVKIADTLALLAPTWQSSPPANPASAGSANAAPANPANPAPNAALAKPAPAAPANSALPLGNPAPSGPKTKFAEWQAITNPTTRDLYYQMHGAAIEASRPDGTAAN